MVAAVRYILLMFVLLVPKGVNAGDVGRLMIPFGHSDPVRTAAVSADRRWLVTGGDDGIILVWDLAMGQPVARYPEHETAINHAAVSRDGSLIFSTQEIRRAELLHSATGEVLAKFVTEPAWVESAAISSDGAKIALTLSNADGSFEVVIVEANSQKVLAHSRRYNRRPRDLRFFAGDQKLFGYVEDTAVINWETDKLAEIGRDAMGAFGLATFDEANDLQVKLTGPGRGKLVLSIFDANLAPVQPAIDLPGIDGLNGNVLAISQTQSWIAHSGMGCDIDLVYLPDPSRRIRFHAAYDRFGGHNALALSFLDDSHLFVACADGSFAVWEILAPATGEPPSAEISKRINPKIEFERRDKLSFLAQGRTLAFANTVGGPKRMDVDPPPPNTRLLDTTSGRDVIVAGRIYAVNPYDGTILTVQNLQTEGDPPAEQLTRWSADGPTKLSTVIKELYPPASIAYLAGGGNLLYATIYGPLYQLSADTFETETVYVPESRWHTTCLVPHPTSDLFIQCNEYGVRVFRSDQPLPIAEFHEDQYVEDAVFDTDGTSILYAARGGVWRFDFESAGKPELVIPVTEWRPDPVPQVVRAIAISPVDGSIVLGVESGKVLVVPREGTVFGTPRRILGSYEDVRRVTFSPDRKFLLVASLGIDIFDAASLELKLSLFEASDGSWIAVHPTGRFDTNNFDILGDFRWRLDTMDMRRAASFEALMEPYFTPGLIGAVLKGEALGKIDEGPLIEAPPAVSIDRVELLDAGRAAVTVVTRPGSRRPAFDLKLFRDGQLVGATAGDISKSGTANTKPDGAIEMTYSVMLPKDPAVSKTVFTAYAFNATGRRSAPSAPFAFTLPHPAGQGVTRTMYVIAVGVNANDNPALVLSHAVASSEAFLNGLGNAIDHEGMHYQLVKVPIVARSPGRLVPGEHRPPVLPADKKIILGVLDLLAGRTVNTEGWPRNIVESLKPAGPDDAVVLYIAAHGVEQGNVFQIMPQDTDPAYDIAGDQPCKCAITDTELTTSFAALDARHLILVLDTCSSASAVVAEGRKLGPFNGSRLGQLIYDKQMIVLVSSEPSKQATALGKTYLTRAIVDHALTSRGLWTYPSHSTLKDLLDYVELILPGIDNGVSSETERAQFYRLSKSIEDRAREITLVQPAEGAASVGMSSGGAGENEKP
ncbi:WD40 repeat domain-containing protein [Sinorhizobium fredii]|uniref:WD40/YVTN repeat-like domain-containing protein n=1 Tax=Rhizobium fredii TaxID=380 RepID=A0A2L0HA22_RHIFR|nr:WD40 repeat domain-containing protein [Sinorhizobium fredii]AUX78325.1 WD40/YVTN repeat-like domain-containing protein [Sinorhizobium fredii]